MKAHVDSKVKHNDGHVMKDNSCNPIVWEQMRGKKDKCFVETNLCLAMLDSHTNLSIIASIDQAIPVEDYLTEHTTKMSSAEMSCIASTMLAAVNFCNENKSKAEDHDSDIRKSKFFASRTENSFQGKMQHEVKTIIAALMGLKSDTSSEKFQCIFPHSLVDCIEGVENEDDILSDNNSCAFEDTLFRDCDECIDNETSNLEKTLEDNILEGIGNKHSHGARFFKVDNNNIVFIT